MTSSLFETFSATPQAQPNVGGDLLSQAGTNITNAIAGGGPGNSFKDLSKALNKRKRRKVAEDLQAEGMTPTSPDYFENFRDKLIEFGDHEGAEIVEAKRNEQLNQNLARRKQEADILQTKAGTDSTLASIERDDGKFEFSKLDTNRKFVLAEAELDDRIRNTDDALRRTELESQKVELQRVRDAFTNENTAAKTRATEAATETEDATRKGTVEKLNLDNQTTKIKNEINQRSGLQDAEAQIELAQARAKSLDASTATEDEQRQVRTELLEAQKNLADSQTAVKIEEAVILQSGGGVEVGNENKVTAADVKIVKNELTPLLKDKGFDDLGTKGKNALATAVQTEMNRMKARNKTAFNKLSRADRLRKAFDAVDNQITQTAKKAFFFGGGTEFNAVALPSGAEPTGVEQLSNEELFN